MEPEAFECVTLFVSHIVGYEELTKQLGSKGTSELVSRLYRDFDALAVRYALFTVDTVGDAYMVAGNLPDKQADHAARVAQFALAAVAAAEAMPVSVGSPSLGTLEIRVGIHSGPVVASVIGHTTPRFCLFG